MPQFILSQGLVTEQGNKETFDGPQWQRATAAKVPEESLESLLPHCLWRWWVSFLQSSIHRLCVRSVHCFEHFCILSIFFSCGLDPQTGLSWVLWDIEIGLFPVTSLVRPLNQTRWRIRPGPVYAGLGPE